MAAEYDLVFSEEVVTFACGLSHRKKNQLLVALQELASNPLREADYVETDARGRQNHTVLIHPFLLTYWLDHPLSEVRIMEILEV